MPNYDKKEIQEAIENIRELRTLLNNKQQILRPIILSKVFINMLFSASILLILTTVLIAIGYSKHDSFWDFSILVKSLIIISILGNFIQILIRKLKALNLKANMNIINSLSEFYTSQMLFLVFLAVLFCIIFSSITNLNWVYLPVITIIYGLLVISFSEPIGIIEFRYMGYLTILVGILSMLFLQIPILLLAFAMFTIIIIIFYIVLAYARRLNN